MIKIVNNVKLRDTALAVTYIVREREERLSTSYNNNSLETSKRKTLVWRTSK